MAKSVVPVLTDGQREAVFFSQIHLLAEISETKAARHHSLLPSLAFSVGLGVNASEKLSISVL